MEGWREVQDGGDYVYLWLTHVDVWQKPIQYCKASILQIKIIKNRIYLTKKIIKFSSITQSFYC